MLLLDHHCKHKTAGAATNLSIKITLAVGTHVKHSQLGTQTGRHHVVQLIARPHQLSGHVQVTYIHTMNDAESKGAG